MSAKNIVVWHLLSNRWNSAITEYCLSSIKALNIVGYNNIFTPKENTPACERSREDKIGTLAVNSFSILNIFHLKKMYYRINPDIIITYGGPETALAQIIINKSKTKLIRFRGQDIKKKNNSINNLKNKMSDSVLSKTIIPSKIVRTFFNSEKEVCVVPLGIDCDVFYPPEIMATPNPLELLIFGRIDPVKGHREFLSIYKKFLEILHLDSKPVLHILGKEENLSKSDILLEASRIGLDEKYLKFTLKRVDNPNQYMHGATLGIIPSLGSEVICRVAEEFLLCGTPIYVSGVGALGEVELDNSCYNYKDLSIEKAAVELKAAFEKSILEKNKDKLLRSDKAKEKFSLKTMGENLKKHIH